MFKVTNIDNGRTIKTVTIEAPEDADRESLIETAISAAGEERHRLFGWSVCYWPVSENWTVTLNTD